MDQIMVAPAHVADRDGGTKQAVTKLVRDLAEKSGLPVERDGRGRERLRQQEVAGNLVRADMLAEALARAGREIQSAVARLPNLSDDGHF